MEILIVRHAHAGDRADFANTGRPDRERPLTGHGRKKFRKSLPGLRSAAPKLARIVTSPFVRAAQTARLLAKEFPRASFVTLPALAHGGSARGVVSWLAGQETGPVALVGHEPDLGRLVGLLTQGTLTAPFSLKKGGAALVSFDGPVSAGTGRLEWMMPPFVLRDL